MRRTIAYVLIVLLAAGCASQFKEQRGLSKPMVALAMEKIQRNDIQGALIELKKANMANGSDPEVYYGFALAYWKTGKYDKALANADKAIEYGDKLGLERPGLKSEAYNLKGTLLFGEGKNEAAIESFKNALKDELYQTPEFAYRNLATVYLAMQNIPLASENVQKALDYNSHYAPAWEILSKIYLIQGRTNDAVEALNHAILEFPGYTEAHWELAELYLQLDNEVKAKEHLIEVIRLDPEGVFGPMAVDRLKDMK